MSFLGKSYTLDKSENFEGFLKAIGAPAEVQDRMIGSKPSQKITKNGDTYTLTTINEKGPKDINFQDGVEFDENVTDTLVAKTTFTVDGNVVIQVQKFADGRFMTINREFSDSGLVVTLTVSSSDVKATRYYVPA